MVNEQSGDSCRRQALTVHGVVQNGVLSLTQRWIETYEVEDFATVQSIISWHGCRTVHNARHKLEALIDISDVSIRHRNAAHCVVTYQS